ncbi:FAD-dependent oxidoreductase [Embleya sp. AB8]|uniref:FAD-dependent oxidoreductase n=1 Tax=Embleya sp. AB8 TaxID=3156304 RepID=UPI003C77280F
MNVIVIGGGVAGAATAIALRRIGVQVTVYEAYAEPAGSVGSFLSLATNGLRVLRSLGVLEQVQRAGVDMPTQRMWSGSAKLLGEVPRGRSASDPLHSVTLMRGTLVEILRANALAAGADIVVGERLVDAAPTETGVRAIFASGHTAHAALLVGADGIRSTTRTLLDPNAPVPEYAGLYSISGVADGLDIEPGVFNMTYARNGAFFHLPAPDGRIWWAAQVATPIPPDPTAGTDRERLARLAHLFRPERLPSAILGAATELHHPTLMHRLAPIPIRHNDRMALLGDAAHPVGAGQGASMALEDAVVLARALADEPSVPAALATYDAARAARIAKMLKAASANRDAKTAGPLARRIRDLMMPWGSRHFHARATDWLYTHDCGELPSSPNQPAHQGS